MARANQQRRVSHHLISEVQLACEFGVNRDIIRETTRALREEGVIGTTSGIGSFVEEQPPLAGDG
ncbi:GntR family transcriptional regulator [Streptomyces sp. AV19]|nr:GntR family transcriptional regulator [Streptomyces sp. AV19]MBH1938768.1 GntR family transcriptional regulator [Streptomyces sp. AV19]MDG4533955.1 GntR family transcriptional regulator [Streptomyces sp. AV19]